MLYTILTSNNDYNYTMNTLYNLLKKNNGFNRNLHYEILFFNKDLVIDKWFSLSENDIGLYRERVPCNDRVLACLNENDVIVINGDDKNIIRYMQGNKARMITYGLNQKVSVTASSIKEDEGSISCCIQRILPTISGKLLLPQEFPVCYNSKKMNVYNTLAVITTALLTGVDSEIIIGLDSFVYM